MSDAAGSLAPPPVPPSPPPLTGDTILECEFTYARESADQAHEDRVRMVNFFVIFVGAIWSFVLQRQPDVSASSLTLLAGLLCFAVGFFTVLTLVRLRQAWLESVIAMNQIKDYYRDRFASVDLEKAFRWSTRSIPAAEKGWTINFMLAFLTASMGSASLAFVVFSLAGGDGADLRAWIIATTIGALALAGQLLLFRWMLRTNR